MSGFVGMFELSGAPPNRDVLDAMFAAIAHRGPDHVGTQVSGRFGVVAGIARVWRGSDDEVQPFVSGSGLSLCFDGRLDAIDAVSPEEFARFEVPDVERVSRGLEVTWSDALAGMTGEFALAAYDERRDELLLARDPVGTKPLYFSVTGSTVIFGSEIKALLRHPSVTSEPNIDMLGYHLLQGTARDNSWDTFFRDVRTIPPGFVVSVTRDGVRNRRFWDFDPAEQLRLPSYADYVDAFRDVFRTAVARRLRTRSPVAVSVSGGIDSSSIFCTALELERSGAPVAPLLPYTHQGAPGSPADEIQFIEAIERRWNAPIARIPLRAASVAATGIQQTTSMEMPWVNELWTTASAFSEAASAAGARTFLSGHWGDQVLYDQAYLVDLWNRGRWLSVGAQMREFASWESGARFGPFAKRFLGLLLRWDVPRGLVPFLRAIDRSFVGARRDRAWFTDPLRAHGVAPAPRRVNVGLDSTPVFSRNLYAKLRSKYYQLALEGDDKVSTSLGLRAEYPFLDRDLLTFVMSIPGEMVTRDGRQRSILRDAARDVLPVSVAKRRSKADFTALANTAMQQSLADWRSGNLDELRAVQRGYVDPETLWRSLPRMTEELRDSSVLLADVADLLGLEFWLQAFDDPARRLG